MEERRVAVVVEDDDDIRGLMVDLLGLSGFEVHEAATGTAGVQAVREHDPVLITVDLGLPDIDGYEVTRRVRGMTDAYLMMLTARTDEIDTLIGLEAGADDYVTKPFRPRELRARVEALLRRPRASRTVPRGDHPAEAPGEQATPPALDSSVAVPTPARAPEPAPVGGVAGAERFLSLDGLVLYPEMHHMEAEGTAVALTPTEFLLLETLLRSGRVVRTKTELFRILRGEDADSGTYVSEADERTIEVHLGNLRRKLNDDPRYPRWIQTVRGVGYRMTGNPLRHG